MGVTTRLARPVYKTVVVGERLKVHLIGSRIFVLRVSSGAEELIFDITETRLISETIHGVRLNGGGSVDKFRVLSREAI